MAGNAILPDFIVIGAMRAGTTTLYHHLYNHPDIGMSRMKETDFFVRAMNYPLGFEWYHRQFAPGYSVHGEVSPNYAKHDLWQDVPKLIRQTAPEVRLIFVARDPVDRFVSHYLHSWHAGHTNVRPEHLLRSGNGEHMLETSRYAAQLKTYLEHFPRERILILDFDELCTDAQCAVDQVTGFLGLVSHPLAGIGVRNQTDSIARLPHVVQRAWRSRTARRFDGLITRGMRDRARRWLSLGPRRPDPEIGPGIRAEAAERLAADAAEFREMTGMAFPGWKL